MMENVHRRPGEVPGTCCDSFRNILEQFGTHLTRETMPKHRLKFLGNDRGVCPSGVIFIELLDKVLLAV